MIDAIIYLLNVDDYYGVSEHIDTAKGKYKLPTSFKEGMQQMKRKRKWQQR